MYPVYIYTIYILFIYIYHLYIYIYIQKGTPWECSFFTVLCTCSDSFCFAHLQWFGMSLLRCNHWQFLLGISAMAKPNKQTNQKTKSKRKRNKWQDPTLCHYFPLGCAILFFLCFFSFLVFCFFGSWFVVGGLKGWQNNTKVKDLGLTLCQFSHFRDIPNKKNTCRSRQLLAPGDVIIQRSYRQAFRGAARRRCFLWLKLGGFTCFNSLKKTQ